MANQATQAFKQFEAARTAEFKKTLSREFLTDLLAKDDLTIGELVDTFSLEDFQAFRAEKFSAFVSAPKAIKAGKRNKSASVRLNEETRPGFIAKIKEVWHGENNWKKSGDVVSHVPDLTKQQVSGLIVDMIKDGILETNGEAKRKMAYRLKHGKGAHAK
jgi:hypothetical protein